MSPLDPLEYSPTPHLIFITLFIIFPLIYLCGRVTFWILWQLALTARYLLFTVIRWLYYDEYVQEEIAAELADKDKKARTTTVVRETTTIRRTTRILPRKRFTQLNGTTHGQIALKHPSSALTTPLENEEEDTTEFEEEELKRDEQLNLRHSPTEDEDETHESENLSSKVPTTTLVEVSSFPESVVESRLPVRHENDSGTEGRFEENFTSPLPKSRGSEKEKETRNLHIEDPNEFPPLGSTVAETLGASIPI